MKRHLGDPPARAGRRQNVPNQRNSTDLRQKILESCLIFEAREEWRVLKPMAEGLGETALFQRSHRIHF